MTRQLSFMLISLATAVTITDSQIKDSSPILFGLMFEDMNHGGDGGIYGELLANRAFQGDNPSADHYYGINANISLSDEALSDALPHSLYVDGDGFYNDGYWGINVQEVEYTARFYHKGNNTPTSVVLKNMDDNKQLASITPTAVTKDTATHLAHSNGFQLYEAKLTPSINASGLNNGLCIYGSGHFGLVSLFGPTYKDRPNGLRKDVAQAVAGMGSHFLRFPGGNNLEGPGGPETRWKWNETVGPLTNRPGRQGDWQYPNTDGLGLHEYLDWIEDMSMTAVLVVWSGLTMEHYTVPDDELQPYIDDVMNELEYILGDESTEYGARRAVNGRQQPWSVQYVEIGNEDFFDTTMSYGYRFDAFNKAIKAQYPNITTIASTNFGISQFPIEETWQDEHLYLSPSELIGRFSYFDNYPVNKTSIFIGEYASSNDRNELANVYEAISEAVYMTGLETNSDKVKGACYAPLIDNSSDDNKYRPDLIELDAASVKLSTSYQVQKLWATSQGDYILTLQDAAFNPLYYVANIKGDTIHVKIANIGGDRQQFNAIIDVDGFINGSATAQGISSSDPNAETVDIETWNVTYSNGQLSLNLQTYAAGIISITK